MFISLGCGSGNKPVIGAMETAYIPHNHTLTLYYNHLGCWLMINLLECFFNIEGHVALDRNPGAGYNTLLLQLILGDL